MGQSFFSLRGSYELSDDKSGAQYSLPGFHSYAVNWFEASCPKGTRVLDIGSGSGNWAKALIGRGYDVVACDIKPDLCQVPCRFADLNSDFSKEFSEQFDAITFMEVIEHLENPRHALRECAKLLKPDGRLYLTTPNASGVYSRVKFLVTGRFAMFDDAPYREIGHITPITYWQLEKCLAEAGLKILDLQFFDGSASWPKTLGDLFKKLTWVARPFMRGIVGTQNFFMICGHADTRH